MVHVAKHIDLPAIPTLNVGPEFPLETLQAELERAKTLMDQATGGVPRLALKIADAISRHWLARNAHPNLAEIDQLNRMLGRPGGYCLSMSYEWACTAAVRPSAQTQSARLLRVLDWPTPGLGRHLIAAHVAGRAGPFVTLTWPGFAAVLQAMAPGRFSAALNQAPMICPAGVLPLDWLVARARVWRTQALTPLYLLRQVFEQARSYEEAVQMLRLTPIASPAIFTVAGLRPDETCIIERRERTAAVHIGSGQAANHYQTPGWRGRPRGEDSPGRAMQMASVAVDMDPALSWLRPPILNKDTRLVFMADARKGRIVAQGYETTGPVTRPLELAV